MPKPFKIFATTLLQWQHKYFTSPTHIRFLVFLHDLCMIPVAWAFAYWLRFNLGHIAPVFIKQAIGVLPFIIFIQALYYWLFGLYRGVWRFASLPDLTRIVKVVVIGAGSAILILFLSAKLISIPRSIFPLYGLLLIVLLGGSRLLYRWLKDHAEIASAAPKTQRVLMVGAGQAGESMVRDLMRHKQKDYQVVAFVDDDGAKYGQEIHGIRVLGKTADIAKIAQQQAVDLIMIAIPSAGSADMRRIVEHCEKSAIAFRTLPSLKDLASGNVQIDTLRAVSLEDLLGRDPVLLDWHSISANIQDKIVLVSGGGGSIGSELCRQIAQLSPKQLIVIEQNEFNLYALTEEFRQKFPRLNFIGHLLDVTDRAGIHAILQQQMVDMIFHAAAYKHVPLLENQLRIAIKNNILGTQVLAEEAAYFNVKKFVLISTDKAVNPTNVMGATKRVAEIFCQNYQQLRPQSTTEFVTVRFGNVLGSTGSVVPLFKKQIEMGGPITVTHPDITRFL
jgi:FlaA1/EpsC-like NDP-sugar epimerase